ncbi:hypothetical protein Q9L58_005867 [Maublancomyces gigas]|uniref:BTB domain-containing protein n=1 Tax=Discina gigas TaxID=1032678 RepID=A0ABR3GH83_9PEZI
MTSEVFELVASDDVRFFINKAILASQSKPFEQATSGPWEEASKRMIELKDWDSDTVARLVEFLYLRNYDYPDPTPLKPAPEPAGGAPEPAQMEGEDATSMLDRHRPLTPLEDCLRKSLPPDEDISITDSERLDPFDPNDYDFQDILLAHAKVYALANYKSVDTLRALALKRLLLTLSRLNPLQPASHILINIVDFASYVYANTDCLSNSQEPLRKLTSQFIALNFGVFQTEPRAIELVAQGGDFVKDIMGKISRRLSDPGGVYRTGGSSKMRYISGVHAVRGSQESPLESRVKEVNDKDSNLSYMLDDGYTVWLVPEYTSLLHKACTKFVVSASFSGSVSQDDDLGSYLDGIKEDGIYEKITEVALYRGTPNTELDVKSIGYDGRSGDIRNRSTSNPLYLVWKSVKI